MLHQFAADIYPDEAPLDAACFARSGLGGTGAQRLARRRACRRRAASGASRAALQPNVLESAAFEIVEPAAAIPDDVEALTPESTTEEDFIAESAEDAGDVYRSRAVARKSTDADGDGSDGEVEPEQPAASRLRDELDAELLEVFLTEATELLPSVTTNLRGLASNPNDANSRAT